MVKGTLAGDHLRGVTEKVLPPEDLGKEKGPEVSPRSLVPSPPGPGPLHS